MFRSRLDIYIIRVDVSPTRGFNFWGHNECILQVRHGEVQLLFLKAYIAEGSEVRTRDPKPMFCRRRRSNLLGYWKMVTTSSRGLNEARRPHTCSRQCAFEEKKRQKNEIPPHPKHTTKSTAARRP